MIETPSERSWGWLVGAILAPVLYGVVYELIEMAVSPEGVNAFAWHDFSILVALPAVIVTGGLTGALWTRQQWIAGYLPWAVALVGLVGGAFPGWAFQYGTFVDLTIGLLLAGGWLLATHHNGLEDRTVALAGAAAGSHLAIGLGLQLTARPYVADIAIGGTDGLWFTVGAAVLVATGAAAVLWWRSQQAVGPAFVLVVWLILGIVGLLTYPTEVPVNRFRGMVTGRPAPDYLIGSLVLPWFMVLARQIEAFVTWPDPSPALTTD